MGKVKRGRQKAHTAAVKVKSKTNDVEMRTEEVANPNLDLPAGLTHEDVRNANLFDGLDMSKYNISTKLPEFDTRSTLTSKSLKGLNLKKKDKKKLRHELWIQKLNVIDSAKKKAAEKKRLEQTPVVGDIGALGDALPTLELLLKTTTGPVIKQKKEPKHPKGIQKEKKRKQQMMTDIGLFQQVLKHPSFKENPTATISEHLHNRHKRDEMDT